MPKQTILVIEDDPIVRATVQQILEDADYLVVVAEDGHAGLRAFQLHRPALVITDIIMPEKEGLETIIELKRDYPHVKIIAISGGGARLDAQYLPSAKALGADKTLEKPFEPREVIEAVGGLLREASRR